MKGLMWFGMGESDWSINFSAKFLKLMEKTLDESKDLQTAPAFSQWMCRQHNYMKISDLHQGNFVELDKQEQEELYRKQMDQGRLFECTQENLKRRWGPLS